MDEDRFYAALLEDQYIRRQQHEAMMTLLQEISNKLTPPEVKAPAPAPAPAPVPTKINVIRWRDPEQRSIIGLIKAVRSYANTSLTQAKYLVEHMPFELDYRQVDNHQGGKAFTEELRDLLVDFQVS